MPAEICDRCEVVEECYEFMLAYAAQGLPSDQGSKSGGQVREFLDRAVKALTGLAETWAMAVKEQGLEPADKYLAFFAVLDRDARDSLAAIELVLAQPAISSQLIDNLNASIHVRALLTDLFLVSEIVSKHSQKRRQRRVCGPYPQESDFFFSKGKPESSLAGLSSKAECVWACVGGLYKNRGVDGCLRAFSAK